MRASIISLFFSNGLAFLATGLSYIYYSKHLDAGQFGLYAIALVLGSCANLILDGGLKTTIIKHGSDISLEEEGAITAFTLVVSIVLITIVLIGYALWSLAFSTVPTDFFFIGGFVGAYLLSYPLILVPTAKLERQLNYRAIGWVESASIVIERGLPAILFGATDLGMYSFVAAVFIGRALRAGILFRLSPVSFVLPSISKLRSVMHLIREGGWYQLSVGSAVVRDNLHVLLIGPLFGKQWVGYYAWVLQLCMISSQVFVQIASRVSLPVLTQTESSNHRWETSLKYVRLLTVLTGPVLIAVWLILPSVDQLVFDGKWVPALGLVPLLFFRMIPGMATTPIGTLVLVEKGAKAYFWVNFYWTLAEVAAAVLFIALLGPTGLVWSYALAVFVGLWLLLRQVAHAPRNQGHPVIKALIYRPSLLVALVGMVSWYMGAGETLGQLSADPILGYLIVAVVLIFVAYLSEAILTPEIRSYIVRQV